ncbi:helix-turn-helix transcriptional regulator [Arthrobacter sp. zg-ZUI227]|nr:helix-turn-helix transcriptional regulator [Arthrobacter jiangjiafuii]
MSGARLAEEAGMSQSYVSRRLLDEAPFTLNDIEPICAALKQELCPFLATVLRSMEEHCASGVNA